MGQGWVKRETAGCVILASPAAPAAWGNARGPWRTAGEVAHLTELALRRNRPLKWSEQLGRTLLEGYASVRQLPAIDHIDPFHWVSLARHVAIAARFAERRHTIPAIAALCCQRLGNHRATDET